MFYCASKKCQVCFSLVCFNTFKLFFPLNSVYHFCSTEKLSYFSKKQIRVLWKNMLLIIFIYVNF